MLIPYHLYKNFPTIEYLNQDILITIFPPLESFYVQKNFLIFLAFLKVILHLLLMALENNYSLQVEEY